MNDYKMKSYYYYYYYSLLLIILLAFALLRIARSQSLVLHSSRRVVYNQNLRSPSIPTDRKLFLPTERFNYVTS